MPAPTAAIEPNRWARAGRALGACVLAVLGSLGIAGRADACVCVLTQVSVDTPAGRVFTEWQGTVEPMPGATVVLRKKDSVVAETTTDDDGSFHFPGVKPGRYTLDAQRTGFHKAGVDLRIRKPRRAQPRAVSVLLEVLPECSCGIACAASVPEGGLVSGQCLLRKPGE